MCFAGRVRFRFQWLAPAPCNYDRASQQSSARLLRTLHGPRSQDNWKFGSAQAASGAGQAAMDELEQQTREALEGKPITQNIFPFQVPF